MNTEHFDLGVCRDRDNGKAVYVGHDGVRVEVVVTGKSFTNEYFLRRADGTGQLMCPAIGCLVNLDQLPPDPPESFELELDREDLEALANPRDGRCCCFGNRTDKPTVLRNDKFVIEVRLPRAAFERFGIVSPRPENAEAAQ